MLLAVNKKVLENEFGDTEGVVREVCCPYKLEDLNDVDLYLVEAWFDTPVDIDRLINVRKEQFVPAYHEWVIKHKLVYKNVHVGLGFNKLLLWAWDWSINEGEEIYVVMCDRDLVQTLFFDAEDEMGGEWEDVPKINEMIKYRLYGKKELEINDNTLSCECGEKTCFHSQYPH